MKVQTGRAAALVIGVIVAGSVVGCTPAEDPDAWRTATPSTTSSPTPTPTVAATPTPEPAAQATSEGEAIEQASAAVQGYYNASFTMMSTPGLDAGYLMPLIVPGSPMVEQAQGTFDHGYRLKGEPVKWSTNAAMSIAGPITGPDGSKAPYGNVELYGCASNQNTESFDADGNAVNVPKASVPRVWSVFFDPASGEWLVYQLKTLVGADGSPVEGAPQC